MKSPNKVKYWAALSAGLILIPLTSVWPEAMRRYFSDMGTYTGNPPGSEPFKVNAFGPITIANETPADAPEGRNVTRITVANQTGAMLILNSDVQDTGIIVERDFSDYLGGEIRVLLKSNDPVRVSVEYSQGAANVQLSSAVPSTGGLWVEKVLPLADFTNQFGDRFNTARLRRIRGPFIIANTNNTPAPKTWYFDDIRWTKGVTSLSVFPSSAGGPIKVNPSKHRQFTVEGRFGADPVVVYTPFSVSAPGVGSMNPGSPNRASASILTAGTADGQVIMQSGAVSTSVSIDNTSENLNREFGLLSESVPGAALDVDSKLLLVEGAGANIVEALTGDEVSTDSPEGSKRFRTTLTVAAGQFAGVVIQHGLAGSPDTEIRDMSSYYDGTLRFWLKAPAALAGKLQFGIRSGNVPAGLEYSKVVLTGANYGFTYNNEWQGVAIPLSEFAKAPPWADLSRTKILCSIFVIGDTGGQQTFYIDNLRWDTRTPGPLNKLNIVPARVTIPANSVRQFVAQPFDANNIPVDVWPNWATSGAIGSLATTKGLKNFINTAGTSSGATGNVTVSLPGVSTQAAVTIGNINYTLIHNVYSDAGAGGAVRVSSGMAVGTGITLNEIAGDATEGSKFMRSAFTLVNTAPNVNDAFAVWYVEETNPSRDMSFYSDGYLHFWVRPPVNVDLEVSVRSSNIPAGQNNAKFRLSELGVPLNGQWQEVFIALNDFKLRESRLQFDRISTYFVIGALSLHNGQLPSPQQFDVDDVNWRSIRQDAPSMTKVFDGLVGKQFNDPNRALVRSFDNENRAVTYDQALAAMSYIYFDRRDLAEKIFNSYLVRFNQGGFNGFHNEYQWSDPSIILDGGRTVGPNAWLLLALIHYRSLDTTATYDGMMTGLANWLLTMQDSEGALRFGVGQNNISTEHNFDAYAVFRAYASLKGDNSFNTAADRVMGWLSTQAWVPSQNRFNVGELDCASRPNCPADTGTALDLYSWAPLATSSFTSVINSTMELAFKTTKNNFKNGALIEGFDFSSLSGPTVDRDAVWLEGTGQMVLAYHFVKNQAQYDHFLGELEKAIFPNTPTTQGLTYATNEGTAYGFQMPYTEAAVSSMAWYLFAKNKFNPFRPIALHSVGVKNVSNNAAANSLLWNPTLPIAGSKWIRANQYLAVDSQPSALNQTYRIQIYTDNAAAGANPRFVDITPTQTTNLDSNPAGLLYTNAATPVVSSVLPIAWSVKDTTTTAPSAANPNHNGTCGYPENLNAFQWLFMKDRATPALDLNGNNQIGNACDSGAFTDGEEFVTLRKGNTIHFGQRDIDYGAAESPDFIYLSADFSNAGVATYTTRVVVEFIVQ